MASSGPQPQHPDLHTGYGRRCRDSVPLFRFLEILRDGVVTPRSHLLLLWLAWGHNDCVLCDALETTLAHAGKRQTRRIPLSSYERFRTSYFLHASSDSMDDVASGQALFCLLSNFPLDELVIHCLQSFELARSFDLNSVMNHEQCFGVR